MAQQLLSGVPLPDELRRPQAKDGQRLAAVALRDQGLTYDEIAAELGVSKSSLSRWLRDRPRPRADQTTPLLRPPTEIDSRLSEDAVPDRGGRARQLRSDGWLLREIAAELEISVTAAWRWCEGLPLPARARHGGSAEHTAAMRQKRWSIELAARDVERKMVHRAAADRVGPVSDQMLDVIAAAAYWSEGSKDKPWSRRERVIFVNSDAGLIVVWMEFLRRHAVAANRLRLNLSIHESADVFAATVYWSEVVGLPVSAFGPPMLKRHKAQTVRKNTGDSYVGCLVIRVLQSRLLYQEIVGLWQGVVSGVSHA